VGEQVKGGGSGGRGSGGICMTVGERAGGGPLVIALWGRGR
jgi:hypothetical protein